MSTSLAIHLDRLVRRIHTELSDRAKRFDTERVGAGGAMLLLTIDELGEPSLGALASRLVRDKSQLTREVASLERKEMVHRHISPDDGRVTFLRLTPKGRKLVARHHQELNETLKNALSNLTEEEIGQFSKLLERAQIRSEDANTRR